MVGGSEPQASITIRNIAIHTRCIDKLYQGKGNGRFLYIKPIFWDVGRAFARPTSQKMGLI
jgi:hypothetical protein